MIMRLQTFQDSYNLKSWLTLWYTVASPEAMMSITAKQIETFKFSKDPVLCICMNLE